MLILSFSHDENLYGAQRSLLSLLNGLKQKGHRPILAIPHEGQLAAEAERRSIECRILPYPYPSTRPTRALRFISHYKKAAAAIRALVAEIKPDIIHFNTAACVAPAFAMRKDAVRKIWHLREAAPRRRLLSRWINSCSDLVVANCRNTAAAYPALMRSDKMRIVYNGLDVSLPKVETVGAARREYGWEEGEIVIFFAGQLRRHKDPQAIVDAAGLLLERGQNIKAALFGEGKLRSTLEEKIAALRLNDKIVIHGFTENIVPAMAAADIVVIPSLVEPFPRVGLEAMALGKPVVATDVGGIPEQVVHEKTGLLVPAGDRVALADALQELAADHEKRLTYGQAGDERHAQLFSEKSYTDAFEKAAQELLTE